MKALVGTKTTVVEHAASVLDIDFKSLRRAGVECVIFDLEGTVTEWRGTDVAAEVRRHIKELGITKIGVATNMHHSRGAEVEKLARQLGAGSFQFPRARGDRKPAATMLEACMAELKARPEQTVMVGDKLLDVLAAKKAGVGRAIWVEKFGRVDHWFDRLVYRKIEPFLKRLF